MLDYLWKKFIMDKFKEIIKNTSDKLMPLCFFSTGFIYIMLWYFNLHQDTSLRKILSIAISTGLSVIFFVRLFILFSEHKMKIVKLCLIPLVWIISFFLTLINNGINYIALHTMGIFIIYSLPVFVSTIVIALENKEKEFIEKFKWFGIILLPAVVFYLWRIFFTAPMDYSLINLGELNYMGIAYLCLPIVVFCTLDIFSANGYSKKSIINDIVVLIFYIALINSGTRGAFLCIVTFIVALTFYMIIMKKTNRRVTTIIISMIVVYCFFMFIWTPPSSGLWRSTHLVKEVSMEVNNTNFDSNETQKVIYSLKNKKQDELANRNHIIDKIKNTYLKNEIARQTTYDLLRSQNSNARFLLYKIALDEANEKTLTGMGSMGFTIKYGQGFYPHNIFLEILADFGYIATFCFLVFIGYIFIKLCGWSKKNTLIAYMLIFFVSNIPQQMVSGTIYTDKILVMMLTYYFSKKVFR